MFPGKIHSAVARKSGRGGKAGLLLFPPGYKSPQGLSLCLSVSLPLCFHFSWLPQPSPVCLEGQQGGGRRGRALVSWARWAPRPMLGQAPALPSGVPRWKQLRMTVAIDYGKIVCG